ncbi:MAG: DUF3084 domain-containing protein [Synergistaceae bacterium]|nr:DUF3084 domain-containing protein [Synergistaceae bacterium]
MSVDLSDFNWQLILIIVAISGAVSYFGDVLGMKIGKKRISLFGLRPRYTSTVITLFTGVGVALLTLAAAAYSSDRVAQAIFGPNILMNQMRDLLNQVRTTQYELEEMNIELVGAQVELSSLKEEKAKIEESVESLRRETESLKLGLAEMKEGRVVAFQGEVLAMTSIEGGAISSDLDAALDRLIRQADEYLIGKMRDSGIADTNEAPKVALADDMKASIENLLVSSGGRKVLRLTAPSNTVIGQILSGVVNMFDSSLIYKEGSVLMRETIRGNMTREDTADALYTVLKQINREAVSKGVMPDPISGTVGKLDTMDFYSIVDQLVESVGECVVTFLAATDIYTEGPVNIRIEVGE